MKQLIIAEKPSLGQNIMKAIGLSQFKRADGYGESLSYIVTWGFGHLFSLYDIEDYGSQKEKRSTGWTLDVLPFHPSRFQFGLKKKPGAQSVDAGVRKQFNTIKSLLQRKDVNRVIHAGDADREGEIIIRIILEQAKNEKPVFRLWLPEQTEESIRKALQKMERDSVYDHLAGEGYARTYTDWLYGVNLTRLATIKAGSLLRVGRVIVPIVEAIYNREMEIRHFVPELYIGLVSKADVNGQTITLTSQKTFNPVNRRQAEEICQLYNSLGAVVTDIKTEKKAIKPGRLFSLSTLQGLLGKRFKITPKDSLAIIQKLYEAGYVTYPRTNTEFLAEAEASRINGILRKLQNQGYQVTPKDGKKSIYDDSKIESHSALTPTLKFASREALSEKEWNVYSTIFNRFLAVFCVEECTVNRTTMTIAVGDEETFTLKGDVMLTEGWMKYEESAHSEKILPPRSVGDVLETNFELVDKQTSPPKHYTVDSLSKYLKNPFREEKKELTDEDEKNENTKEADEAEYKAILEGVELGTEATRTSIIENAIQSKYIQLKNDTYTILPGGEFYIETLRKLGICLSKEKTAEMGRLLKQVYKGSLSIDSCVILVFKEIQRLFVQANGIVVERGPAATSERTGLGICPQCGGEITKNKFGNYSCRNWKNGCKFTIYGTIAGKKLTESNIQQLLSKGRTREISGFISKAGKPFSAKLVLMEGGKVSFEFSREKISRLK